MSQTKPGEVLEFEGNGPQKSLNVMFKKPALPHLYRPTCDVGCCQKCNWLESYNPVKCFSSIQKVGNKILLAKTCLTHLSCRPLFQLFVKNKQTKKQKHKHPNFTELKIKCLNQWYDTNKKQAASYLLLQNTVILWIPRLNFISNLYIIFRAENVASKMWSLFKIVDCTARALKDLLLSGNR